MALQQALNTVISVLVAALLAEWLDAKLGAGTDQIAQVELALVVLIGGVFSFVLDLVRALVLDTIPAGKLPRLYKLLGGTLVALMLACAGAQTPAQRYYVAKANYASLGDLVNAWCAQPSTPVLECAQVDEIMDRTEAEVQSIEALAGPSPGRYELATAFLLKAVEIVNRILAENGQ
jgi:hypothetical protein